MKCQIIDGYFLMIYLNNYSTYREKISVIFMLICLHAFRFFLFPPELHIIANGLFLYLMSHWVYFDLEVKFMFSEHNLAIFTCLSLLLDSYKLVPLSSKCLCQLIAFFRFCRTNLLVQLEVDFMHGKIHLFLMGSDQRDGG